MNYGDEEIKKRRGKLVKNVLNSNNFFDNDPENC